MDKIYLSKDITLKGLLENIKQKHNIDEETDCKLWVNH